MIAPQITFGPTSDGRWAMAEDGQITRFFDAPYLAERAAKAASRTQPIRQYFHIVPGPEARPAAVATTVGTVVETVVDTKVVDVLAELEPEAPKKTRKKAAPKS